MTPENFCYWLHGWFEIGNPASLTTQQLQEIKNHLDTVFNKITPVLGIAKEASYPLGKIRKLDMLNESLLEPVCQCSSFGGMRIANGDLGLDHQALISC